MSEAAFSFPCGSDSLVGILHQPETESLKRGVLFVVGGGPQFRVGGHRQLTLWSRRLCREGYPVFRFDYRGMGDAHGSFRGFEDVAADIRAAIDHFFAVSPSLQELVLWGECDASAAILFYAHQDSRVKGLVLLNPWVRTEGGEAKAILRFYYLQRLLEPSFWRKVLSLRFNPFASLKSAVGLVQKARSSAQGVVTGPDGGDGLGGVSLPKRLFNGFSRFSGPVMLVLSGRDLIAREFEQLIQSDAAWGQLVSSQRVTRHDLAEGDHTFSSAEQRNRVVSWGVDWLKAWP